MKLFHSIFIIFSLITAALALECYSCSGSDGNCDNQETCTVIGEEKCMTRTVFSMESGAAVPVQYYRGCSTCSQSTYKNGTHTVVEDCCSDMLCNGQSPRALQRGLPLKCYSYSLNSNTIQLKEVQCKAEELCVSVIHLSGEVSVIFPNNGCATKTDCQQVEQNYQKLSVCCDSNLCNNKIINPSSEGTSITGSGIFLSLLAVLTGKVFY